MTEDAAMGKRTGKPKTRKSKKVEDLSVKKAKDVVGGVTFNYGGLQVQYKPQDNTGTGKP